MSGWASAITGAIGGATTYQNWQSKAADIDYKKTATAERKLKLGSDTALQRDNDSIDAAGKASYGRTDGGAPIRDMSDQPAMPDATVAPQMAGPQGGVQGPSQAPPVAYATPIPAQGVQATPIPPGSAKPIANAVAATPGSTSTGAAPARPLHETYYYR